MSQLLGVTDGKKELTLQPMSPELGDHHQSSTATFFLNQRAFEENDQRTQARTSEHFECRPGKAEPLPFPERSGELLDSRVLQCVPDFRATLTGVPPERVKEEVDAQLQEALSEKLGAAYDPRKARVARETSGQIEELEPGIGEGGRGRGRGEETPTMVEVPEGEEDGGFAVVRIKEEAPWEGMSADDRYEIVELSRKRPTAVQWLMDTILWGGPSEGGVELHRVKQALQELFIVPTEEKYVELGPWFRQLICFFKAFLKSLNHTVQPLKCPRDTEAVDVRGASLESSAWRCRLPVLRGERETATDMVDTVTLSWKTRQQRRRMALEEIEREEERRDRLRRGYCDCWGSERERERHRDVMVSQDCETREKRQVLMRPREERLAYRREAESRTSREMPEWNRDKFVQLCTRSNSHFIAAWTTLKSYRGDFEAIDRLCNDLVREATRPNSPLASQGVERLPLMIMAQSKNILASACESRGLRDLFARLWTSRGEGPSLRPLSDWAPLLDFLLHPSPEGASVKKEEEGGLVVKKEEGEGRPQGVGVREESPRGDEGRNENGDGGKQQQQQGVGGSPVVPFSDDSSMEGDGDGVGMQGASPFGGGKEEGEQTARKTKLTANTLSRLERRGVTERRLTSVGDHLSKFRQDDMKQKYSSITTRNLAKFAEGPQILEGVFPSLPNQKGVEKRDADVDVDMGQSGKGGDEGSRNEEASEPAGDQGLSVQQQPAVTARPQLEGCSSREEEECIVIDGGLSQIAEEDELTVYTTVELGGLFGVNLAKRVAKRLEALGLTSVDEIRRDHAAKELCGDSVSLQTLLNSILFDSSPGQRIKREKEEERGGMVVCKQEEGTNDSEAKVQEEENDTEDRQREFNERRELVHLYVRLSVEHPADILARLRVQQIMLQEEKQRFARKVKVGVKGLTARDSMSLQNAVKCLPPPGQLETPQPGDGWWGGDEDPGWPGDGNGFTFRDATRQQRSQIPWPAMARMWGLLVPDVIGTTMQGFLPVIPPHVVKSVWGDYGWRGGEAVGRRFRDEIDISVNVDTFGDRLLERAEDFFCLFDEDQAAESFQKSIASDEEKDSELKQCVAECMQQEESRRERVRMEEEGSWALGSAGGSSGGEEDEDMKSVPDVAVGDVAPGPDDPVEEVSDPGSSNQSEETIEASDEGDQERGDGIPWYADRRGERVRGQTTREQTERERERLMDDNESEEEEDEDEWWAGGGTGRGGGAGEMELEGPQYGGSGLFEREGGEGEDTGRRVGDDRERGGETGDPNPLWKRLGPQGMEPLKRWDYDEPIDFEGDEAEMMDEDEIRFEGDDAGGSVRAPSVPAPSSILAPSARGQEEEERRSRRDLEPGLLPLPLPSRPPSQFSGGSQHHHLQAAPFLLHSSDHHAAAASWQGGGGGRQEGLLDLPLPLGPPSAVPSAVSSSWFNTQHQHQHQGVYQPPAHQNRPLSPFGSASANPIGGGLGFGTVQEGLLPHPPPSPLPVAPFGAGSGGGDGMRMEGGGEEEEEEDEDPEGFVGDGWDDGSLGGGGGVGQEVPQGFHEHPPHTHIRVSEASPLLQHFPVVSRDEGEREGDEDLVEAGDFSLGEDTLRESRKRSYPFASTTAGAVPLSLPGVQAAALRLPHPSAEFSWLQGGKGEGAGDQRTRGQWEVQGVSQPPPVGAACMLGTESENEESSAEGRYGEAEQTDEHTHKAKKPKTTDTQMTRTEQKDESSSSGMACDHQEAAERPSQHSPFPVEGLESSGPSCFLSKEASEGMLAELLARRPTEMHHREGTEAKVSQKPEAEEMKAAPVLTWAESEELTYRLIDRERDLYMKLATREILEVSKLTRSLPLGLPLRELEDKGAKGKMWACVAIEVVNSLRLHASTPLGAKAVLAALFRHELAPTAPGTGGGERIEEEAKEAERDKIPPAADGEGGEKKFLVSMALQQNFGGEEMHTSAGWFGEGPETSDNMCPSPSTALISSHEREQGGFESTLREEQTSRETGGRGYADWAEDKTKEEEKTSDCWSMHFSTTPVLPVTLRALLMIADMHTSTREFIFDKLCSEMRRQFSPWLFQAGESPSHASSSSSSSFAAVALERDHRRMVVPGRGEWGQRGGAGLETAWGAAGGDGGGRGGLPPSPSLSWAFVGGPLSGRGGRTEGRLHRFDRSSHGEALRRESREAKITCLKKFSQFCNGFRELAALGLFPPVLLFFEDLASSLNDALFVNSLCEAVYRMMPAEGRSPVFMRRNLLRGEGMGGSFGLGKVGKGKGKGGKGKYAKGKGKAKVHANPNRQNSEKRATVDERGDAPSTCTCRNFLRFARAVVDRIDRMLQVVSVPSNEDWGHSFACASSSSSAFSSSFSFAALAEWDRVGETVGMILDKTEEVTTAALEDADQREKTLQAKKDCLEDILFDVQEAQKTFKELDAMLKQVKRLRK